MNTNSNKYTILYAIGLVVIVAFLLAFVSSVLSARQAENVAIDKKKQILAALNIRDAKDNADVSARYAEVVVGDMLVNAKGEVVDSGKQKDQTGFALAAKDFTDESRPVYLCRIADEVKYVFPVYGRGLWGGLWGYIAADDDLATVYGAYISHESETAGLGALIAEEKFHALFQGKHLFSAADSARQEIVLTAVKHGKVDPAQADSQIDGITGATLTTNGVAAMLHDGLSLYLGFIQNNRPCYCKAKAACCAQQTACEKTKGTCDKPEATSDAPQAAQ